MKRGRLKTVTGYVGFFLLISAIITVATLLYNVVDSASGGNAAVIAGAMFAVIMVLALICTLIDYLRRRYTVNKPVAAILNGVRQIAAGDFNVRLTPRHPYDRYDEFDVIMDNINTLAAELSKVEVFRTDFIANVSHEIKTPLAIIQSYASALQGDIPEKTRREYAATLAGAARRLTNLVTNVLKLNKPENQEILPRFRLLNAGELLRERLAELEEVFENKGLGFDCDIEDASINTDESFLEIVWNNLISNAVKFTPAGGTIFVSLKDSTGTIVFTVRDTGCGMSAETGEHIFDKFYQGDTSRAQEGNGLGLALVKKVVDLLGGEISVHSALGKGSTFVVKLRK